MGLSKYLFSTWTQLSTFAQSELHKLKLLEEIKTNKQTKNEKNLPISWEKQNLL